MPLQTLEPFLFPNRDYDPFVFHSNIIAGTSGVETTFGKIITKNKWLRIYSYELMASIGGNNTTRLRFVGNGFGDYCDFYPAFNFDLGYPKNVPIFALIPPCTEINFNYIPGSTTANHALRVSGFYFNWAEGDRPIFRKFLRPFFQGWRLVGASGRNILTEYSGGEKGNIVFDNFRLRSGTTFPNINLIETNCEALFDLNGIFGDSEGVWKIPLCGEARAINPFYIAWTPGIVNDVRGSISGYIGGNFEPDYGCFAPTKNSLPFAKSFSVTQLGSNVRTRWAQIQVPNCKFVRLYLLQWTPSAVNSDRDINLEIYGDGLSEYSFIPPTQGPFGARQCAVDLTAKVRGGTIIEIFGTKLTFGNTAIGGTLYGWTN